MLVEGRRLVGQHELAGGTGGPPLGIDVTMNAGTRRSDQVGRADGDLGKRQRLRVERRR